MHPLPIGGLADFLYQCRAVMGLLGGIGGKPFDIDEGRPPKPLFHTFNQPDVIKLRHELHAFVVAAVHVLLQILKSEVDENPVLLVKPTVFEG